MMTIQRLKGNVKDDKGFTLVELSIVLVIIGLILGAVTVGTEMVRNARIKRLGSDLQGYYASAYTYFDRKNELPGDSDNDGQINDSQDITDFFDDLEEENIAVRKSNPFGGLYEAGYSSSSVGNIGNYVRTPDIVPLEFARILDAQLDDGLADGDPDSDLQRETGNIRYDSSTSEKVKVYIRL